MMSSAYTLSELCRTLGSGRVQTNVRLAPFTTFKIGGPADLYYEAHSAEKLETALLTARRLELPHFLLGMGANILMADGGFRGMVIRNVAEHVIIEAENGRLWAESGAVVYPDVIEAAVAHGLAGFEHYVGIPSTIGGALWQNLHFLSPPPTRERTVFIEEILESATVLFPDGEKKDVDNAFFEFGYDDSVLQHQDVSVLSAVFRLQKGDPAVLRRTMEANLAWRRQRHPPLDTEPSAGSVFKKIEGIGAGRLIDQCGLKGARVGGAVVSRLHANFIVNASGATASDVLRLIEIIQRTVERSTGYQLQTEIRLVGQQPD